MRRTFIGLALAALAVLPGLAIAEDLESNELVDIAGSQRGLIELHAELLHPNGSHVNHARVTPGGGRPPQKDRALYRRLRPILNRFLAGLL